MSNKTFKPAWWLPNAHMQTLWPAICRGFFSKLVSERERIELPDGDFIDLDWVGKDKTGPLVIVLHGFEGSIESHYAKGIMNKMSERGWRSVLMHFRGCSGEPNRLPRGYHSGETQDISFIAKLLCQREPNTAMSAIGYSLGGNVLLKWLGETQSQNPLKAAIAVSVPFELHKTAARIKQGFARFYQWYFLKCLRERLAIKFRKVPSHVDSAVLRDVQTIQDFDDCYTAPLHGFNGAMDYYTKSSSRQYLRTIQVPTLILQAKDDPLMPLDIIPSENELSPYVKLEITEAGGHVGFVSGTYPWKPEYWLEKRIPDFLQEFFP